MLIARAGGYGQELNGLCCLEVVVVKRCHLMILGASCLFLGGCSEMEMRGVGPVGMAAPVDHQGAGSTAMAALRPSRRQRRNAEWGRHVRPGDNLSCLASASGSPCCDFPAWLREAQKFEGLYAGHNPQHTGNAARPRLTNSRRFNEYGENLALLQMWKHALPAMHEERKYPVYDARVAWSGVFVHWCLTRTLNPKTDTVFQSVAGDPSVGENWLQYGIGCEPCFGAVMVVEKDSRCHIAFCVGAIHMPLQAGDKPEDYGKAYIGFGGTHGNGVGMALFAASDVRAFRLPPGYRPCKEHFKLECSSWVDRYQQKAATTGSSAVVLS